MSDVVSKPITAEPTQKMLNPKPVESGFIQENLQLNHLSYTATTQRPFIIDYFDLKDYYPINEAVTAMAKQLHELLVKDENNTLVEETKQELDYMIDQMNLDANDAGVYKLKKVLTLAQIRDKQRQLEQKKLSVLENMEKLV